MSPVLSDYRRAGHLGTLDRFGRSNKTRSTDRESMGKRRHSIPVYECPHESCAEYFEVEADLVQHVQVFHSASGFNPHDAHKHGTRTPVPSSQPQRIGQWFCFHCTNGPMLLTLSANCTSCHRPRDRYSKVERHHSYSWRPTITMTGANHLSAYSMFGYEAQKVQCIDIGAYEDGSSDPFTEEIHDDLSLKNWLLQKDSISSGTRQTHRLRVIAAVCDQPGKNGRFVLPFSILRFKEILDCFNVTQGYLSALIDPSAQVFKSTSRYEDQHAISMVFKVGVHATGHYTFSISHDGRTGVTNVLILAQSRYYELDRLLQLLEESRTLHSQALLIPALVVGLVMNLASEKIEFADHRINVFEEDLGQHTYVTRRVGDPLKIDFTLTTRVLNSQSTTLGINEMRLNAILLVLEKVEAYSKIFASMKNEENLQVAKDASLYLEEHVEFLQTMCRHLLLRNSYEQKRTQTQLAVVYNFMAQKDNLLTIDIATASKRDSSAMKTIAFVTMVFLPGTFVASFFSIPIFNWNASGDTSVVGPHFYIYWATTIPLTVVVLLIWLTLPSFNRWRTLIARSRYIKRRKNQ